MSLLDLDGKKSLRAYGNEYDIRICEPVLQKIQLTWMKDSTAATCFFPTSALDFFVNNSTLTERHSRDIVEFS